MTRRRLLQLTVLILFASFLLWRTMVSYFPPGGPQWTDAVKESELVQLRRDVDQLKVITQRVSFAQAELQNSFDELRQFVNEKNLSVPISASDLTRFQDLEAQVRFLHNRTEQDLGRMRNVESALRNLVAQLPEGRPYALHLEEIQRQVDSKLAQFESTNRDFGESVDKRVEQWNDTLQFLAAILAILAGLVTAFAGATFIGLPKDVKSG